MSLNNLVKKVIDKLDNIRQQFLGGESPEEFTDRESIKKIIYKKLKALDEEQSSEYIFYLSEQIQQIQTWKDILSSVNYNDRLQEQLDEIDTYDLVTFLKIVNAFRGGIYDRLDHFDKVIDEDLNKKYPQKADQEKISYLIEKLNKIGSNPENLLVFGLDLCQQSKTLRVLSHVICEFASNEESKFKELMKSISEKDLDRAILILDKLISGKIQQSKE